MDTEADLSNLEHAAPKQFEDTKVFLNPLLISINLRYCDVRCEFAVLDGKLPFLSNCFKWFQQVFRTCCKSSLSCAGRARL
jgi:hypothetical protein